MKGKTASGNFSCWKGSVFELDWLCRLINDQWLWKDHQLEGGVVIRTLHLTFLHDNAGTAGRFQNLDPATCGACRDGHRPDLHVLEAQTLDFDAVGWKNAALV
jgi:hypothetical protein